jgi:uncharacterized protein
MHVAPKAKALTAILLLSAASLVGCDAKSGPAAAGNDTRQVAVVGTGQVKGAPDTLIADASVEFTAPDVTTAMNQASERQQAIITALIDSGVDRKDIATSNVSLQPQYATGGDNIVGYRAENSLEIHIRKLDKASQTLALIVTTGGDATRISSVSFSIEDDSQLVRDARARAFDDAKARAQQYADLSGLKLGSVLSISESGASTSPPPPPRPVPSSAGVAESIPVEPGQQTVGFSVTVIWELT